MIIQDGLTPQRILIVDDEVLNRTVIEAAVSGLADIFMAVDGETAIQLCEHLLPDVILLDISMPGMNGIDVCKHIKSNPRTAESAVIMVTAMQEQRIESQALAAGAIDFLVKPINHSTCRLKVENHLRTREQARQLKLGKQDMESLVNSLPVHISYWTTEWINQYTNDEKGTWFALSAQQCKGQSLDSLLPSSLTTIVKGLGEFNTDDSATITSQYELSGKTRHVQVHLTRRHYRGIQEGFLLTLLDISSLRETQNALHLEKERLKTTLNSIGDAVIAIDQQGNVSFMNPIAERMTGRSWYQSRGKAIEEIMQLRDATSNAQVVNPARIALEERRTVAMALNCQLLSADGEIYRVEDSAAPIRDEQGHVIGSIIVFHDVSEAIAMAIKMNHLANHDQLTDLPNRILLQDRIDVAIRTADQNQSKVGILLLDVDHFQFLNDALGHGKGDLVIKQVAERLTSILPSSCTLARIGGDEFAIVIPDIQHLKKLVNLCEQVSTVMRKPFVLTDGEKIISLSIGVSVYPTDGSTQDEIIRHADAAMFRAKQEGRNRYCFFSEAIEQRIKQRHAIEQLLRDAISQNMLEVFYQPKVSFHDRKIVGAEALVRLWGTDNKLVSPAEFIPLAEETGLINQLGKQVLEKACSEAAQWLKQGYVLRISVNVASAQLCDVNFIDQVKTILSSCDLPASTLQLEVTETALMQNIDISKQVLEALHNLGISIAIDDFGTGYSSLSYLKQFPVDVLKIDQTFVREMENSESDLDIVKTIISLGKVLGLRICPEGIETESQFNLLNSLDCSYGQGFLFSKPIDAFAFKELLQTGLKS